MTLPARSSSYVRLDTVDLLRLTNLLDRAAEEERDPDERRELADLALRLRHAAE